MGSKLRLVLATAAGCLAFIALGLGLVAIGTGNEAVTGIGALVAFVVSPLVAVLVERRLLKREDAQKAEVELQIQAEVERRLAASTSS